MIRGNEKVAIVRLLEIMRQLRDPILGCEWDARQTLESLIPYLLEEVHEVIDVIQRQDNKELCQELGDLLLQIVFCAQIAKEKNLFDFADVCHAISDKLEKRHPHIFVGKTQDRYQIVNQELSWEQQKTQERLSKQQYSLLADLPKSLPALMRADKIQRRCASVGFDWISKVQVLQKVHEELREVEQEINQTSIDSNKLQEEIGDLLFSVVNLSRHFGFKAEIALRQANEKFCDRFSKVEHYANSDGKSLLQLSLEEMEVYWQKVKQQENK